MTRGLVLRALCGAWLAPAASLVWMGFASTGLRQVDQVSLTLALGRTQALAVLLAVFTVPVAATGYLRSDALRSDAVRSDAVRSDAVRSDAVRSDVVRSKDSAAAGLEPALAPAPHLSAVAVAVPAAAAGVLWPALAPVLFPVAALAGFWAALVVPRWLFDLGAVDTGPLAALTVGVVFQLTVGWLHVAHPAAAASPALVAEGLILAWAATAAARTDPFPELVIVAQPGAASAAAPAPVRSQAAVYGQSPIRSQAQVRRSRPEAAVGR